MNIPIFSKNRLKFMAVSAYILYQLEELDSMVNSEENNKTVKVIGDEESNIVNMFLKDITSKIRELGYTYEYLEKIALSYPMLTTYYNSIAITIKKHIDHGDYWIPALFSTSIFQQFVTRGYLADQYMVDGEPRYIFTNEKDGSVAEYTFTHILDYYAKVEGRQYTKTLNIAVDVYERLFEIDKEYGNRNKKKRKKRK